MGRLSGQSRSAPLAPTNTRTKAPAPTPARGGGGRIQRQKTQGTPSVAPVASAAPAPVATPARQRFQQGQEQAQAQRGFGGEQSTSGHFLPELGNAAMTGAKAVLKALTEGTRAAGQMYGQAAGSVITGKASERESQAKQNMISNLISAAKKTQDPTRRQKLLADAAAIAKAPGESEQELNKYLEEYHAKDGISKKTLKKVGGKSAQLAVEAVGAGAIARTAKGGKYAMQAGRLARGAKAVKLPTGVKDIAVRGAKASAEGFGYGTAYGASQRISEGGGVVESVKDAAKKEGLAGAALGGTIGTGGAANAYRKTEKFIFKKPERIANAIRKQAKKAGVEMSGEQVGKLAKQYAQAPAKKAEIDTFANKIAEGIPGARVKTTPVKGVKPSGEFDASRAISKQIEDGEVRDLARNTIVVENLNDVNRARMRMREQGITLDPKKNYFEKPTNMGYRGAGINHKNKLGQGEIQVNIPEMIYVKEEPSIAKNILGKDAYARVHAQMEAAGVPGGVGHELYEQDRKLISAAKASGDYFELPDGTPVLGASQGEHDDIIKQSRAYYDRAMQLYEGRAAQSTKGLATSGITPPAAKNSSLVKGEPNIMASAKERPANQTLPLPSDQATSKRPSVSVKSGYSKAGEAGEVVDGSVIQSKPTTKPSKPQGTPSTTPKKKIEGKPQKATFKAEDVTAKPEAFQLSRRLETLNKRGAEDYKVKELVRNFDENRIADNKVDVVSFDKPFTGTVNGKKVAFEANKPYVVSGHNRLAALQDAKAQGKVTRPDADFFNAKKMPAGQDALDQIINESIETNVRNKSVKDINLLDLAINGRVSDDALKEALAYDPKRIKFVQEVVSTFKDNDLQDFWSSSVGKKMAQLKDLDFAVLQERLNFVNRIGKKINSTIENLTPAQQTAVKNTLAKKVSEVMSLSKASSLKGVENNITKHLDAIRTGGFSNEKLTNLFGEQVTQSVVAKTSGVQGTEKALNNLLKSKFVPEATKAKLREIGPRLREPAVMKFINEKAGGGANSRKTQGLIQDLVDGKVSLPKGKADDLFVMPKKTPVLDERKAGIVVETPRTKNENIDSITIPKAPKPQGEGKRGKLSYPQTVKKSDATAEPVKQRIRERALTYEKATNKRTLEQARAVISEDIQKAHRMATDPDENSAVSTAIAHELMGKYQNEKKYDDAFDLMEKVAARAKDQGQAIQALSMWGRLTPEGALKYAMKVTKDTQKDMAKRGVRKAVRYDEMAQLLDRESLDKWAKKRRVPHISTDMQQKLMDRAAGIQKMAEGRARDIEIGRLMDDVAGLIPAKFSKRIGSLQSMAMLLNPKTFMRNIGGNTGMVFTENLKDVIGTGIDKSLKVITGKRTTALPSFTAQAKGGYKGLKLGLGDAMRGIDTSEFGSGKYDMPQRVWRGKYNPLNYAERLLNAELRGFDRAAYQAAFDGSIVKQSKALKLNKGLLTPKAQAEMAEVAHAEALYRTFQDENRATKFSRNLKKILNYVGTKDFGLGDLVHKFPQVPANILARGADYTVGGVVKALYHMGRPVFGRTFNQAAFVDNLSRSTVGIGGLAGAGYLLGKAGVITGTPPDDYDLQAVQKAGGERGFMFNVDAFKRYYFSGMDESAAKDRDGDLKVSYDWAQPAAAPLTMGVNLAQGKMDLADIAGMYEAVTGPLAEQSVVTGVSRFAQRGAQQGWGKALTGAATDLPSTFVPTISNQFRQRTDKQARETYDPNMLKESINQAVNRIPGLSKTLRPRIDVWGKEQPVFQTGKANTVNVFFNPAITAEVFASPESQMVLDLWQETGEMGHSPRMQDKTVVMSGNVRKKLNAKEYESMKRYTGSKARVVFNKLAKDKKFNALPPEKQVKVLAGLLTDIGAAAKIEVLKNRPKTVDKGTLAILAGNYLISIGSD